MTKFLKKTLWYLVILIGFIFLYTFVCDNIYKNGEYYLSDSKRYWQLSIEDQQFDYIVLGSSRAYGAINVKQLDSLTSQKGVNLGLNGSGFKENFVSLKLFLLNDNKTKKIYFQIDPYSFMSEESFSNAFHAYTYLPFWDIDSQIEHILYEEIPVVGELPFYFPYIAYLIYNNYYSPIHVLNSIITERQWCENSEFNCVSGDKIGKTLEGSNIKPTKDLDFNVSEEDIKYYDKIIELARSNNIEIIGFTAPTLEHIDQTYYDYITDVRPEFLFENQNKWMCKKEYFSDNRHINLAGREHFTNEFSDFLLKLCPYNPTY
jgi:hypothetical protein